jgi:lipoate-protein ligase A
VIEKLYTVETDETNPYRNIALEALLLEKVEQKSCILYLWQNRHSVIIGRNQNAWKECRVEELEKTGGFLARRLSGGGAVYHDLGNLNFTFLLPREEYDIEKQTEVILRAVRMAGIEAQRTGRNDIETRGRKFSGNAFYFSGANAYHHGTILVKADTEAASKYLSVQADKFRARGVESVRKRIINLTECRADLSIPELKQYLAAAFDEVYGGRNIPLELKDPDQGRLEVLENHFSDPAWKYGRNPPFSFEVSGRFPWGGVEIRIEAVRNTVNNCVVFSDAMDETFILNLGGCLNGAPFTRQGIEAALKTAFGYSPGTSALSAELPSEAGGRSSPPARLQYCGDIIKLLFDKMV